MADRSHPPVPPGPVPLTSFLGRDQEWQQLTHLLGRPDLRLLTVTGPGGIGKSRLVHHVMVTVGETFADGAVFVPLAPVLDAALVLPTVAQVLGVPDTAAQPLASSLHTFLAARHLLLVLDNAEHLLEAVVELVTDLLGTCPGVTVLVTSRVRLGLTGEQVVPLGTLDSQTARALFAARAEAVAPAFAVTGATAPIIDAICDRLDRLPLAIELAAARSNVLPPQAFLARLDHRLDLLAGGPRDAPDRQRTLRATIAWSHDLLPEPEQGLYRCLGVFVGGFTLEAVQAVVGGQDALAGVSALVDASLVIPAVSVDDEPRFTMLETIREDAQERLEASGEAPAIRTAHLHHVVALVERHWTAPTGHEKYHWLQRLGAEQGNIRAALAWALVQDPVQAAHLAGTLCQYWVYSSSLAEGRDWLERTRELAPALPAPIRARVSLTSGWIAKDRNDLGAADVFLTDAAATARAVGDHRTLLFADGLLGEVVLDLGDIARARAIEADLLAITAATEEPLTTAVATLSLGRLATGLGDLARAQTYLEAAVAAHRVSGSPLGIAVAQAFLGEVLLARGDPAGAARQFRDAIDGFAALPAWGQLGLALAGFAAAMVSRMPEAATRLLSAAAALLERVDVPRDHTKTVVQTQAMHRAQTALGEAAFAAAWTVGEQLSWDEVRADVQTLMAIVATPVAPAPQGLSPRELEVLRLVAEGQSNRAIAATLSISERTVENHVLHILTKLGLASRTAAATWAVRHGLA